MSNKTRESNAVKIVSVPKKDSQLSLIILLFLLSITVLVLSHFAFSFLKDDTITINNQRVNVTVADTSDERAKGLSGKDKLAKNEGMLFVFNSPDYYCIWMKDMKFPIDMIWLDKNKNVVSIKENVSPDTYPQSFCPNKPSRYVLELQAGKTKQWQISEGNQANF